jgi:redox-sensitive bicupin YhaK (pirin superfamily)
MTEPRRARSLLRIARPTEAAHGNAFRALRIGAAQLGTEGNPFFNIDHFFMAGPTFPPHPHAGFSAVTYVLPESPIGMVNRDSQGDRSDIAPGGLHWTAASSGIVHEEVPAAPGTVEGMQIFVRQPVAQEQTPPRIHRVEASEVPMLALADGGWLRVLAGSVPPLHAPFEPPSELVLADASLAANGGLTLPATPPSAPWTLVVYLFRGELVRTGAGADREAIQAPAVLAFATGADAVALEAGAAGARLLVMGGAPLDQPSYSAGPFVLSSQAALADAVARYQSGAMGRL